LLIEPFNNAAAGYHSTGSSTTTRISGSNNGLHLLQAGLTVTGAAVQDSNDQIAATVTGSSNYAYLSQTGARNNIGYDIEGNNNGDSTTLGSSATETGYDNKESISAKGSHNSVSADIIGNANTINELVIGDNNHTLSSLNGSNNKTGSIIIGTGDSITQRVGGQNNQDSVNLIGNYNSATVSQGDFGASTQGSIIVVSATGDNNTMGAYQGAGSGNTNSLYIKGSNNMLSAGQQGNGNLSAIFAYGNNNAAGASQNGNNNVLLANLGTTTSAGTNNNIQSTQQGDNNNTNITFNGSSNYANVSQTNTHAGQPGNSFALNYVGNGKNVTVNQTK
jgi:hypothetical protein